MLIKKEELYRNSQINFSLFQHNFQG